jgi:hypothetical protein
METLKKRKVKFKNAGDSITIGGQRFDASNITPEKVDALIAINAEYGDHFEFVETEHDTSKDDVIDGQEKLEKKPKPARGQPAE